MLTNFIQQSGKIFQMLLSLQSENCQLMSQDGETLSNSGLLPQPYETSGYGQFSAMICQQ